MVKGKGRCGGSAGAEFDRAAAATGLGKEAAGIAGHYCFFEDRQLCEIVGAAIVRSPGSTVTEDELVAHLSEHLAKYKVPERIWFLDDPLPRNANGKFLKRELRETLAG